MDAASSQLNRDAHNSSSNDATTAERVKQLEDVLLENSKTIDALELRVEMTNSTQLYSEELEERVKELEGAGLEKDSKLDVLKHQLETLQMIKLYSEELEGRVGDLEAEVLEWSDRCVKLEEEMDVKVGYLQQQVASQRHGSVSMLDNTTVSKMQISRECHHNFYPFRLNLTHFCQQQ